MMKKNGREDSGRYGIILGSEVILKVDPEAARAAAADDSGPEPMEGRSRPDQSVVLSTARSSERALLALVDGRRTVQELVRASGMSDLLVRRHLRALCERGVLIPTNLPAGALPPSANAPEPAPDSADSTVPSGSGSGDSANDGLSKALSQYLDSGKTATMTATMTATVQAPSSDVITVKAVSGSGPAAAVATDAGSAVRGRTVSPPLGVVSGEWPRPSYTASTFKPNVTAFWIPSSTEQSGPGAPSGAASTAPASPSTLAAAPSASAAAAPPAPLEVAAASPSKTQMWHKPADGPPRPGRTASPPRGTIIVTGSAGPPDPQPLVPELAPIEAVPGAVGGSASRGRSAAIPFRLGEYEVATRIAQGGMGSIYVCRRAGAAGPQRLFTLKVIRQHAKQVAQVVQSFRREARVGALLNHPNLQTVVHVGTYHEQPFLILDYVEGIGLAELMAGQKRLPPAIVVSILVDVLRGLKAAHDLVDEQGMRLGLVHGDVSPQNILVGVDGNARLTDFGSARFSSDARASEAAPVLMGKPAFMSPEQLCADPIDARTDLFSLGVVLWSALTGQALFAADSYDQIVMNIFRKKIPPPSELGAPSCFDEILTTALSRAPDGRYSSAEEMANALSRAARNDGIVGSPYDVGQWVRREFAETLAERRRRVQVVFGGQGTGPTMAAVMGPSAASSQAADAASSGGADKAAGEKLGATSADGYARLPSRTIQLPAARRSTPRLTTLTNVVPSTSQGRWRVVMVTAAIAFPFAVALAYLVSNPLVKRIRGAHPAPSSGAALAAPGRPAGVALVPPTAPVVPGAAEPTPAPPPDPAGRSAP